jgi:hypothetical protein
MVGLLVCEKMRVASGKHDESILTSACGHYFRFDDDKGQPAG